MADPKLLQMTLENHTKELARLQKEVDAMLDYLKENDAEKMTAMLDYLKENGAEKHGRESENDAEIKKDLADLRNPETSKIMRNVISYAFFKRIKCYGSSGYGYDGMHIRPGSPMENDILEVVGLNLRLEFFIASRDKVLLRVTTAHNIAIELAHHLVIELANELAHHIVIELTHKSILCTEEKNKEWFDKGEWFENLLLSKGSPPPIVYRWKMARSLFERLLVRVPAWEIVAAKWQLWNALEETLLPELVSIIHSFL